ncbi:sigma factor-like helix-turn-helix DNA-binding protein [Streptomyces sp. NPDC050504]|uniref:sigma factor-like helix-turn-helix DNA-binding protein n=1 Tax=Streptomyces sp. NPDC050504 TaxID=3365618 RepID=UPI0037AD5F2D
MTQGTTGATPLPPPKERRRLREARALTEEQLAAAMGVTRATVRSWEAGRTSPRGRKRDAYAKLLASGSWAAPPNRTGAAPAGEARAQGSARPRGTSRTREQTYAREPARPLRQARARGPVHTREATGARERTRPAAVEEPGPTRKPGPTRDPRPDRGSGPAPEYRPGRDVTPVPASVPLSASAPAFATPAEAFDALYSRTAPGLVRQTYLLTGRRKLSTESVERAFHLAWQRWPEVAVDRDPAGWVRAAAYEYAMSPWHRLRPLHKHPDAPPKAPGPRALRDALLRLPPPYRRTVLLYDGLGLDLPETAAETEASTPAAANRLLHARAEIAHRVPELAEPELLHERLGDLALAVPPAPLPAARTVRTGSERRARFWTRAAIAFTALIIGATAFTLTTAPTAYEAPHAPGTPVNGLPVYSGPLKLTPQDLELQQRLRAEPANGPGRLVPELE